MISPRCDDTSADRLAADYPYARDQLVKTGAPTMLAFHDGFITPGAWQDFFNKKQRQRTLLDTREYAAGGL